MSSVHNNNNNNNSNTERQGSSSSSRNRRSSYHQTTADGRILPTLEEEDDDGDMSSIYTSSPRSISLPPIPTPPRAPLFPSSTTTTTTTTSAAAATATATTARVGRRVSFSADTNKKDNNTNNNNNNNNSNSSDQRHPRSSSLISSPTSGDSSSTSGDWYYPPTSSEQQHHHQYTSSHSSTVRKPITFSEVLQHRSDSIRASLFSRPSTASSYGSYSYASSSSSRPSSATASSFASSSRRNNFRYDESSSISLSLSVSLGEANSSGSSFAGSRGSSGSRSKYNSSQRRQTNDMPHFQTLQQYSQYTQSVQRQQQSQHQQHNLPSYSSATTTTMSSRRTNTIVSAVSAAASMATRAVYRNYQIDDYALVISEGSSVIPTNLTVQPASGKGRSSIQNLNCTGLQSTITPAVAVDDSGTNNRRSRNRTTRNRGSLFVVDEGTNHRTIGGRGSLFQSIASGGDGGDGGDGEDNDNNDNNVVAAVPIPPPSRPTILVNKYGYPKGKGNSLQEERGPYLYLLTRIKIVHYEEHERFWTVIREDNGEEMRGDAQYMTQIPTHEGLEAALYVAARNHAAALGGMSGNYDVDDDLLVDGNHHSIYGRDGTKGGRNGRLDQLQRLIQNCCCIFFCFPVFCIYEIYLIITESAVYMAILYHGKLFLNGIEPYKISCRITTVNLIVVCSIWYLFIDQVRLMVFIPESEEADLYLTVVNFVVWLIMVFELIFEYWIRPEHWSDLVRSDQAFTPKTLRYINGVHLVVETISLVFFMPVFLCLFTPHKTCSETYTFSFYWATLASVVGPDISHALAGRMQYAIVRVRIFALVRHWRNAWIEKTFHKEKKYKRMKRKKRMMKRHHQFIMNEDDRSIRTIDTMDGFDDEDDDNDDDDDDDDNELLQELVRYGGGSDDDKDSNDPRHRHRRNTSYLEEHNFKTKMAAIAKIEEKEEKERENAKKKASNIGTALMTVNSHRALFIFCLLTAIFPMIFIIDWEEDGNPYGQDMVDYLQTINLQNSINDDAEDDADRDVGCDYLLSSVEAWIKAMEHSEYTLDKFLLALSIRPARCYAQFNSTNNNKFIGHLNFHVDENCPSWSWVEEGYSGECIYGKWKNITRQADILHEIAGNLSLRVGNIVTYTANNTITSPTSNTTYAVSASYNYTHVVVHGAGNAFALQLSLLIILVWFLKMLRYDAVHLVLGSLRSMLRIIALYAKDPLAQSPLDNYNNDKNNNPNQIGHSSISRPSTSASIKGGNGDGDEEEDDIGTTYETEQLVMAVSKITDLLRKCWGVAGANIISTNLASKNGDFEVFNPTVPGKNVFALFAFAKINDFDHAVKNLEGDVMILINDVAAVLHGEVFRWGLGDTGQCNKNLGSSFLMVFKIGSVVDTIIKLEEATQVIFSTNDGTTSRMKKRSRSRASSKSNPPRASHDRNSMAPNFVKGLKKDLHAEKGVAMEAMDSARQLSLDRIPGIRTFTDRAVIGMLKSFAGIHRDNQLRAWSRDFRLSAGVGTWKVDMIFGMHAGWAVEGAVGSEYKIDATYLSPHVNMAARMMSASKHYGVNILVSEAIQELMSEPAKKKMRNLDRVTVKGSSAIQKIYTYDSRAFGADFFLYSVTDTQAEHEARSYKPSIWETDADLKAMRHHVTEEFDLEFNAGLKCYYEGDWPAAIELLESANEIMVAAAMEGGYLHDEMDNSPGQKELYRRKTSDKPSRYLINFMKSKGSKAPEDWDGWHPLLSK